jgi:glycosyltransferase involved in cell wall biosynthesis
VSVVVPTYNRSRYVGEAVDSVLAQTLRDLELIVVDDGSTDDTADQLARFAGRLEYVRTENQGPARARNEGMKRAKGDYIAYLDSDDRYYPFKLQLQVSLLERHPDIGLVYSESSAFDDEGWFDEWHLQKYHHSAYARGVTYERLFQESRRIAEWLAPDGEPDGFRPEWRDRRVYFGRIFHAYLMNTVVFTPTILFRRSLLDEVGLQEPRFGLFHDLEFVLRLCRHHPVAFIDVPTYMLRYHAGQISTTTGPDRGRIAIRKQRALLRVFEAHRDDDAEFSRAHRALLDRQEARLRRAVAVPMLSLDNGTPHEERHHPRRARLHLRRCAALGHPSWFLWMLSFAPHFVRRVGMAALDRRQRFASTLKRMAGTGGQG